MASSSASPSPTAWWTRPGLGYVRGELHIGGHAVGPLVRAHGTPLYLNDAARVTANLGRLRAASPRARCLFASATR